MNRLTCMLGLIACSWGTTWADTHYYLIEGVLELATGRPAGTSVSLVKRTLEATTGQIQEIVLSMRGNEPATETTTIIRVDGDNALLSSEDGGFEGKGILQGPSWGWTHISFSVKLKQGMVISAEEDFVPNAIRATKRVLGPDGKLQIIIRESGHEITPALYEALRGRLKTK